MRRVGGELADLLAGLRSGGEVVCACGERFFGAGETCFDCDQREIRRAEAGPQVRLHVPARYRGRGFEAYDCPPGDPRAREAVASWGGSRGLFLWSRTKGAGKSHLAFALLQAKAVDVRIAALEWTEYLAARKAQMAGGGDEGMAERLRSLRTAGLALIDDVGTGQITDWAVAELWGVVNARYLANAPTVVTSNYGLPALAKRLSAAGDMETADRIASRIAEMCVGVEVKAQDYRIQGAKR